MKALKERQKQREYLAKVNSGEIKDPIVTHGTDDNGDVIGNDMKPVSGTAAKGFKPEGSEPANNARVDYTKLRSHADLNGEKGLAGRTEPEGWGGMSVEAKQAWLTANPVEPSLGGNVW